MLNNHTQKVMVKLMEQKNKQHSVSTEAYYNIKFASAATSFPGSSFYFLEGGRERILGTRLGSAIVKRASDVITQTI